MQPGGRPGTQGPPRAPDNRGTAPAPTTAPQAAVLGPAGRTPPRRGAMVNPMADRHPYLLPLRLPGGAVLPHRIVPAPMEGITTGAFCAVLSRARCVRCWVTPFLRVTTGVPRTARLRAFLGPYLDSGLPAAAQIMGLDTDLLCATAARLAGLGAAAIDLNCACPSRTVLAGGAGAARLRHPDWIAATLGALRDALPRCGLGIKLRSGLSDPRELEDVLPAVAAARPDFVTLHYRTAAEQYGPVPGGWDRIARARETLARCVPPGAAPPPLIGCGDVRTAADALRLHRQTGADGVAAARGLLANPWLLREIELACTGRMPALHGRAAALGLLREMVLEAARTQPGRRPGFALEIARTMLGPDAPLFRELARCRTMRQAADRLEAASARGDPCPATLYDGHCSSGP